MTRRVCAPLRQPPVVGEMIAGLLLGPSRFGGLMPRWSAAVFAPASLPALSAISQIGLVLHKDRVHATVVLSVDLISRAVRVEVDAMDVRPC